MLKEKGVQAIPIAYYYSFRHDQRPELFIKVGKRIEVNTETSRSELTHKLEQAVTTELDSIKSKLVSEDLSTFDVFMTGRKTLSEWLTWWKEKVRRCTRSVLLSNVFIVERLYEPVFVYEPS
ncbi:hypothetical protein [Priestia flexa]|uniref:hypothetical protein n=1 Tax=Priestia flexa TaxID=86664 RepID=UPI00099C536D|nr:hypothetical protein [Priestia flexa]AQX54575.1 hypothetical protein BC359_09810 [Priestia flexa]